MNTNTIACPTCLTKIEITAAMSAQIEGSIRQKLEAEAEARDKELQAKAEKLAQDGKVLTAAKAALEQSKADLAAAQAEIDGKVKAGIAAGVTSAVAAQKAALAAAARKEVEAELATSRQADADRIASLEARVKAAQKAEIDLIAREREIKDREAAVTLAVAKQVEEQLEIVRDAARKQVTDEHQIRDKQYQEQTSTLRAQIDELKRKLEQGSQQAQGEALELILEDQLAREFPHDDIRPVAKGVRGADMLQVVIDPSGQQCGSVLWETKNTKKWSPAWLAKLRENQRESKADVAVLVTEVLAPGLTTFGVVEGVWVCRRECALGLAAALRQGLTGLAKARLAAHGREGKQAQAYEYLTGNSFRQRVAAVLEPLAKMRNELVKERAAMERMYGQRTQLLDNAVLGMSAMYGDLQGIVGANLPTLEALELPMIEAKPSAAAPGGSPGAATLPGGTQEANTIDHRD